MMGNKIKKSFLMLHFKEGQRPDINESDLVENIAINPQSLRDISNVSGIQP